MIDVMFFMLVFFMLFFTLKGAQAGVPVDLPKTVHTGQVERNDLVISINRDLQYFYGKDPVDLPQLTEKVGAELQKDPQTRVVITPDAAVPYSELVKLMDTLAGIGVEKPLWGVDRRQIPKSQ